MQRNKAKQSLGKKKLAQIFTMSQECLQVGDEPQWFHVLVTLLQRAHKLVNMCPLFVVQRTQEEVSIATDFLNVIMHEQSGGVSAKALNRYYFEFLEDMMEMSLEVVVRTVLEDVSAMECFMHCPRFIEQLIEYGYGLSRPHDFYRILLLLKHTVPKEFTMERIQEYTFPLHLLDPTCAYKHNRHQMKARGPGLQLLLDRYVATRTDLNSYQCHFFSHFVRSVTSSLPVC
jgi:hypothetical protein